MTTDGLAAAVSEAARVIGERRRADGYRRTVSFASLNNSAVGALIERVAAAEDVTLIVGAGASMEASLPSWTQLIERLLRRVAREHPRLTSRECEEAWIARTQERDDLLAAGATVEAMANDDLDTLLPEELYGAGGAGAHEPGPIAHEVAELQRCFGGNLTILTTNYDDLIDRALPLHGVSKKNIRSYVRRRQQQLRAARSHTPKECLTLRFDPRRFPPKPAACYRASWQLPGPDLPRQATTSLRWITTSTSSTSNSWAHSRLPWNFSGGFALVNVRRSEGPQRGGLITIDESGHEVRHDYHPAGYSDATNQTG